LISTWIASSCAAIRQEVTLPCRRRRTSAEEGLRQARLFVSRAVVRRGTLGGPHARHDLGVGGMQSASCWAARRMNAGRYRAASPLHRCTPAFQLILMASRTMSCPSRFRATSPKPRGCGRRRRAGGCLTQAHGFLDPPAQPMPYSATASRAFSGAAHPGRRRAGPAT
jgi:hypothetical protein